MILLCAFPALPLIASPDFEKEVAPVLEQTCLFCHNAHETKGDLDLSTRAAAFAFEGTIVPGDPEASLLIEVVSGPRDVPSSTTCPMFSQIRTSIPTTSKPMAK